MPDTTPDSSSRRDVLRTTAVGVGAAAVGGWIWEAGATTAHASGTAGSHVRAETYAGAAAVHGPLDTVVFGDPESEQAHGLTAVLSDTVSGGLGQPARVLNQAEPVGYWGGAVKFTVACAPRGTTYVTVKLWGDDQAASENETWRLQLFCDGLQIGHQDQGAVDNLDILGIEPRTPGRFFFHTLPLPEKLTRGKKRVELEIRSMGRIWSYGQNQAQLYRAQTTPSRGLYRLYTHAEPYVIPPRGDVQGPPPVPGTRTDPVEEILGKIRVRVAKDQKNYLTTANPWTMDAWAFQSLAEGYLWEGSPAHRDPVAVDRVCQAIDGRYAAWLADPAVLTGSDQQRQGFGRVGLILALLWEDLGERLDERVTGLPWSIANSGFDTGGSTPTGWTVPGWAAGGTMTRDTSLARTGLASMKLAVTPGKLLVAHPGRKTAVDAGGTYEYGAWIRTEGVSGEGAYIDPLFFDANGKLVGTDTKVYAAKGTHDWEYVSVKLTTPAGATQIELHLRLAGEGTAWFDDVAFVPPADASKPVPTRREAYTKMLVESRDHWRRHFPHYSNQAQICAIGLYQANRGLRLLAPELAYEEKKARGYLYQSIGIEPWLGRESEDGTPDHALGTSHHQVSAKGLTKELGYVGNYGEVTDWLIMMYESVTRGYDGQDAPELRDHMLKIIKARGYFRTIDVDGDGNRIARIETVVGWRNEIYPGETAYASRTAWDTHPVMSAAVFRDPELVGWTQEMMADGQFTSQLALLHTHTWTRVGLAALRLLQRDWPEFQKLPARPGRLPTDWDEPDFTFTDEECGVVAVKHGKELLYASLYWRARQGVNDYARVHHVTPSVQRSATVRSYTEVPGSTETYTVNDWVCWDYAINDPGAMHIPPGGFPPPGPELRQSLAGDVYQLAPPPADVPDPALGVDRPGVEKLFVGRAPFYRCAYGPYVLAMNTTKDRTFRLDTSDIEGFGPSVDLVTGRRVGPGEVLMLKPLTTVVLRRL
ncbi:twin-arginine translocation signal domain-containing protein [Streptomyces sp. 2A115]|uniref:twin-arginine translocation signal domain-containing protein n=1 Tax=Streptomyces sp. 2A115 TaxID=3457439 RepID=UPI003FD1609F